MIYLLLRFIEIFFIRRLPLKLIYRIIVELILILFSGRYAVLWQTHYVVRGFLSGLIVGQFLFLLSLFLTSFSVKSVVKKANIAIKSFSDNVLKEKKIIKRYLLISFQEELFWRATIQFVLPHNYIGVTITAFLFTLIHIKPQREAIYVMEFIDLFIFAMILGTSFMLFENIWFLVIVHTLRNLNIYFLQRKFIDERKILSRRTDKKWKKDFLEMKYTNLR